MSVLKRNKDSSTFVAKALSSAKYWTEAAVLAFTEELSQAMERERITQAELARRVGVSPAFVSKIFRGNVNLTLETINKFALAVGMSARVHIASKDQVTRWIDVPSVAEYVAERDGDGGIAAPLPVASYGSKPAIPKVSWDVNNA